MASISGALAKMGVKIATTWGTATTCGAGNQLIAEANWSSNGQELVPRAIGSGRFMDYSSTLGAIVPTVSLTGEFGYHNNWPVVFAAFFGTSGAPTEVTGGQADYLHTITFNTTLNAKYVSFAFQDTGSTSTEFPTCAVRSIGLKTTTVPGYLEATAELLANKFEPSTSANTFSALGNVTLPDSELAVAQYDDDFWIDDASTGALASGDQYNITGFDWQFARPQEIIPEIKGSAGNGAPIASGIASGTFNVTVKELADHAYYTTWTAETVKKGLVTVEGTQIGSGTNKAVNIYLPNLKLVQEPQYAFTQPGVNALTLNFKLLSPSAAPTGMSSVYPYLTVTNGLSTSLLA